MDVEIHVKYVVVVVVVTVTLERQVEVVWMVELGAVVIER